MSAAADSTPRDASNTKLEPSTKGQQTIVNLDQVGKDHIAQVGGKGANLGELVHGGFPVPPGFVITTSGYDAFVTSNRLEATIAQGLSGGESSGESIRSAFERAPIPPTLEAAILTAYGELGQSAVAVRSSATAEDLPEAAFAGQQDTYLNIIGTQALLDAVRRCWASLWTDRAIAYRERQAVDHQTVKLAIVVQRMVDAAFAGVMFTANPVTGARDESVIDASPGLGESVVSGLVTPDHYVLQKRKSRWTVHERRQGRREVIIRAQAGGGTEHVESMVAQIPPLPDDALIQLAQLGEHIERHFGQPQDIEWARVGDSYFIVQARPITALPPPLPKISKPVKMFATLFAEMAPVRPYPLDQSSWIPALSGGAVEPMFELLGIHIPPINEFMNELDGVVTQFSGNITPRPTPALLLMPFRLWRMSSRFNPAHWHDDPVVAEAEAKVHTLEAQNLQALSWAELLKTVDEALPLPRYLAGEIRCRYLPRAALSAGVLRVMLGLLGQGGHFGTLMSGVETLTLEANRALEALAAEIRADIALSAIFATYDSVELYATLRQDERAKDFMTKFDTFLDRFGHRETVLTTVSLPTWKHAPDVVLGIIKSFAQTEPRHETGQPAWEIARDAVLRHPLLRLSPLRSLFLKLLGTARYLWQIRENTHFNATRIMPLLHRTFFEFGRRLVTVGVLQTSQEVFHLKLDDLRVLDVVWPPSTALSEKLRGLVQKRKTRRESLANTPLIDPRLLHRPKADADEASSDLLLRGVAGSPGIAEGVVCIIRDGSEFGKLRAGEVLVAPYTNPAWTPLFQRASAVIVDAGGAGSHAAIVAREYHIPAVMGTIDATRTLVDGQRVRVDGHRGRVYRV